MALSPRQIANKTEVTFQMSDLTTAGALNDWQLASLKGIIQANAVLIGDNEVIITDQKKGKYEYGGYPNRISFPVSEDAELDSAKYAKPSMVKVPFDCQRFDAVQPLNDTVMRNSLERGNLGAWCMQQAAPRIALDMEEYGLQSDTTLGTVGEFDALDGLIVQVTTPRGNSTDSRGTPVNIAPGTAATFNDATLYDMRVAMPKKFMRDKPNMRYYCSPTQEGVLKYARINQYGDRGYDYAEKDMNFSMTADGIPIFPVPGMPDDVAILTHSKNIVWFIEKNVTWEFEREAKKARTIYIVRYYFDVAFAVPGAVVAHTNLAVPTVETA